LARVGARLRGFARVWRVQMHGESLHASRRSPRALDAEPHLQEEVRNVARLVGTAVKALRAGELIQPDKNVEWPRPK
jgi:hypothetical protein